MLISTPDVTTIISAPLTTKVSYNTQVRDWANATETEVNCVVQPVAANELLESAGTRDQVISRYKVWYPVGTRITAHDRIRWGSLLLAVDGEPQVWHDIFGTPDHVEVLAIVSKG